MLHFALPNVAQIGAPPHAAGSAELLFYTTVHCRLSSLAILSIKNTLAKEIDFYEAISKFADN